MAYKWYILPIGWLYTTYHPLQEPEKSIDFGRRFLVEPRYGGMNTKLSTPHGSHMQCHIGQYVAEVLSTWHHSSEPWTWDQQETMHETNAKFRLFWEQESRVEGCHRKLLKVQQAIQFAGIRTEAARQLQAWFICAGADASYMLQGSGGKQL